MRTFQIVVTLITLCMVLGMFGFNLWMAANFSKGIALPSCYLPLNYIATALVLLTAILVLFRK